MIKTIHIKTLPRVIDLNLEKEKTLNILQDIYVNFPNESNLNNKEKCIDALCDNDVNYIYVPPKFNCWDGRYVRFISKKNTLDMKLLTGGFVVNDNGYTIKVINNNKILSFNKRNYHVFMLLNEKDLRYAAIYQYLN